MHRVHISPLSCSPDVQRLQLLLNSEVVPSPRLVPDGVLGPRTANALKTFQAARGFTPSGSLDADVWAALGQRSESVPRVRLASNVIAAPWMAIAEAELGVEENRLPHMHSVRIVEYHHTTRLRANDDETPWCSSFVNWVLLQAGLHGTNDARAISWLKWGYGVKRGVHGAITVLKKKGGGADHKSGSSSGNHVGFCASAAMHGVQLLGGNQGGGRRVCISNYSFLKYDVLAYRWPHARGAQ